MIFSSFCYFIKYFHSIDLTWFLPIYSSPRLSFLSFAYRSSNQDMGLLVTSFQLIFYGAALVLHQICSNLHFKMTNSFLWFINKPDCFLNFMIFYNLHLQLYIDLYILWSIFQPRIVWLAVRSSVLHHKAYIDFYFSYENSIFSFIIQSFSVK